MAAIVTEVCDNHRRVLLLSIAGNILARVLLSLLLTNTKQALLPESPCGFRQGRGTADMGFAARQEKYQEQNYLLYTTFVDLTKAFDTVSREDLWKTMSKCGFPGTVSSTQCHDGMMGRVLDD